MRIGIIADIHGNYEALKSVLEDIKKSSIDKIICLGDTIGKGVNSTKCINLLKENCDIVLMGNTDCRFLENPEDYAHCAIESGRIRFNQSLLNDEDKDFLSKLPFSEEFYMSGNLVRLFHATPTSCFGFVNDFDKSYKEKLKMFLGTDKTQSQETADIVICGHLHYPYVQRFLNKTLICAGSVGNSVCLLQNDKYNSDPNKLINHAHYVVLTGEYNSTTPSSISFEIKSVPYDIKKELESNVNLNPEYEAYAHELLYGSSRKTETINKLYIDQGYDLDF